ncbi:unnamed protein product [Allacma fusca]|uniref:Uncharacterized protein n=1 Tax=Allacma fusca TaxID=39272 RepID=A0A8J2K0X0_9HEXA|nr:unnamed protein product [Allacma fusca]
MLISIVSSWLNFCCLEFEKSWLELVAYQLVTTVRYELIQSDMRLPTGVDRVSIQRDISTCSENVSLKYFEGFFDFAYNCLNAYAKCGGSIKECRLQKFWKMRRFNRVW